MPPAGNPSVDEGAPRRSGRTPPSWVLGDLSGDEWAADVRDRGPFDAVVSTTAVHWLSPPSLARCFAVAAALLKPGGVLVDGDHIHDRASSALLAAGFGQVGTVWQEADDRVLVALK